MSISQDPSALEEDLLDVFPFEAGNGKGLAEQEIRNLEETLESFPLTAATVVSRS